MLPRPYQRTAERLSLASRLKRAIFRIKRFIGTGKRRAKVIGCTTLLVVLFVRIFTSRRVLRNLCYWWDPGSKGAKALTLGFGPPTYEKLKRWEDNLPQHNLDLPYPEGRTGRYVKFSNQIKKLGWNNVLNELLMNAHLAHESNRAYVFQDYVWKSGYYAWSRFEFLDYPPRTPLNAIISGPVAGGTWGPGDNAPRSISERWFDVVCPVKRRRIIDARKVKSAIEWSMGDEIFETWRKLLAEAPEPCIEIVGVNAGYTQTFDLFLWGSNRILPLWESFSKSPVSRLLSSSPIVDNAVDRNEHLFLPHGLQSSHQALFKPYDRMLAMHVRRGDFKKACLDLATWNSTFYSWNLLEFLPDKFEAGPGGGWGWNTPENNELYIKRCLPSWQDIVQKVKDSKEDYVRAGAQKGEQRTLDVLYLLSNDNSEWMDQLKDILRQNGWVTIRTSRDLVLDQEQTDVSMAVDMDIARRSAVFVGNGWSSFTSNIVHRRLVDGKEPISIRFY